jgi:hypothetical protein
MNWWGFFVLNALFIKRFEVSKARGAGHEVRAVGSGLSELFTKGCRYTALYSS